MILFACRPKDTGVVPPGPVVPDWIAKIVDVEPVRANYSFPLRDGRADVACILCLLPQDPGELLNLTGVGNVELTIENIARTKTSLTIIGKVATTANLGSLLCESWTAAF